MLLYEFSIAVDIALSISAIYSSKASRSSSTDVWCLRSYFPHCVCETVEVIIHIQAEHVYVYTLQHRSARGLHLILNM